MLTLRARIILDLEQSSVVNCTRVLRFVVPRPQYLECTVVHTGYHPLRNGDPFLPPTAPIGTGTDTSTSRYQTTSLLASGASTELLLEQSTWVARARCRATFEGSFRRHEAGCRFVHFCEQTFAPHSVVSAFLRRLLCFRASDAAQVACGGCRI